MLVTNGAIAECCQDLNNRRFVEVLTDSTHPDGVVVRRKDKCSVCGRHHYSMVVPPIKLSVVGKEIASAEDA